MPMSINHFAESDNNNILNESETKKEKKSKNKKKPKNLFDLISSKKNDAMTGSENGANLGTEKSVQPKIKFNDVFQLTEKDFEEVDLNQLYKFQMEVCLTKKIIDSSASTKKEIVLLNKLDRKKAFF